VGKISEVNNMIDSKDEAIIKEYLEDSRQSYREIARKTGISASTVAARVAKMEEEGIIKKYTIQVDPEKLGYDLTVVMSVDTQAFRFFSESHNLDKYHVNAVYVMTGEDDLIIIAKFRNRQELAQFTQDLVEYPSVKGTKTQLVLITKTEDFNKI